MPEGGRLYRMTPKAKQPKSRWTILKPYPTYSVSYSALIILYTLDWFLQANNNCYYHEQHSLKVVLTKQTKIASVFLLKPATETLTKTSLPVTALVIPKPSPYNLLNPLEKIRCASLFHARYIKIIQIW